MHGWCWTQLWESHVSSITGMTILRLLFFPAIRNGNRKRDSLTMFNIYSNIVHHSFYSCLSWKQAKTHDETSWLYVSSSLAPVHSPHVMELGDFWHWKPMSLAMTSDFSSQNEQQKMFVWQQWGWYLFGRIPFLEVVLKFFPFKKTLSSLANHWSKLPQNPVNLIW